MNRFSNYHRQNKQSIQSNAFHWGLVGNFVKNCTGQGRLILLLLIISNIFSTLSSFTQCIIYVTPAHNFISFCTLFQQVYSITHHNPLCDWIWPASDAPVCQWLLRPCKRSSSGTWTAPTVARANPCRWSVYTEITTWRNNHMPQTKVP